jgi:hypothetical protein
MRLAGGEHDGSEITGPSFSPDGTRLYFSSQRGRRPGTSPVDILDLFPGADQLPDGADPTEQAPGSGLGITFEITGPFRTERIGIAAQGILDEPAPAAAEGDAAAGSGDDGTAAEGSAATGAQDDPIRQAVRDSSPDRKLASTGGGGAVAGAAALGAAAVVRGAVRGSDATQAHDEPQDGR